MSDNQRYNCEGCGETYHEDNLDDCARCRKMVCYRCSVWVEKVKGEGKECLCNGCARKREAGKAR